MKKKEVLKDIKEKTNNPKLKESIDKKLKTQDKPIQK